VALPLLGTVRGERGVGSGVFSAGGEAGEALASACWTCSGAAEALTSLRLSFFLSLPFDGLASFLATAVTSSIQVSSIGTLASSTTGAVACGVAASAASLCTRASLRCCSFLCIRDCVVLLPCRPGAASAAASGDAGPADAAAEADLGPVLVEEATAAAAGTRGLATACSFAHAASSSRALCTSLPPEDISRGSQARFSKAGSRGSQSSSSDVSAA